jgi:soluble lytic murein transglycosylase-like protein
MTAYRDLIVSTATARGLSPNLVEAFVLQESSGNTWAWNPESAYRYLWDVRAQRPFRLLTLAERASEIPPDDFYSVAGDRDNEWWAQQASWGLLQIMGALARELGFVGPFLTELCDPAINLRLGCLHLSRLMVWAHGDMRMAAAAFNGGRGGHTKPDPQRYASHVMTLIQTVSGAHPESA